MKAHSRGFTLIELAVTLTIVAILYAQAAPRGRISSLVFPW